MGHVWTNLDSILMLLNLAWASEVILKPEQIIQQQTCQELLSVTEYTKHTIKQHGPCSCTKSMNSNNRVDRILKPDQEHEFSCCTREHVYLTCVQSAKSHWAGQAIRLQGCSVGKLGDGQKVSGNSSTLPSAIRCLQRTSLF